MEAVEIKIKGKVHGVGFRYNIRKKAKELNVSGFVKNMEDGSVFVKARGDNDALEKLALWCKKGTIFSRVESVEIKKINSLEDINNDFLIIS